MSHSPYFKWHIMEALCLKNGLRESRSNAPFAEFKERSQQMIITQFIPQIVKLNVCAEFYILHIIRVKIV